MDDKTFNKVDAIKRTRDSEAQAARRAGTEHTRHERINRLRARLREVKPPNASAQLVGVMNGMLDLLADEL